MRESLIQSSTIEEETMSHDGTTVPTMNAVIAPGYGSPDVLRLERVARPTPKEGEVLVEIHAVAVHAGDWRVLRANPWLVRLMFGLTKPKHPILGCDVAGRVVGVGAGVTELEVGDEVYGDVSAHHMGAFAEYVSAPVKTFAKKPASLSLEDASAVPVSALTALQAVRDHGKVKAGMNVLITGASGGVGSYAVQIAKVLGAEVTAVGGTQSLEMLRSLGADHVVDYREQDVTKLEAQYDLVVDVAAYRSITDYRPVLKKGGIYLQVGGSPNRFYQVAFLGGVYSMLGDAKFTNMMAKPNAEDLAELASMIDAGLLRPVIGERFDGLDAIPDALRHVEKGRAKGKVVVRVR